MSSVIGQDWWVNFYESLALEYNPNHIDFKELFKRYVQPGGTCFEVGCYPGSYLIWLGKEMDMEVNGIDWHPGTKYLPRYFYEHGVKVGEIIQGDFLNFDGRRLYDLVFSVGFVEHFLNFDEVIIKHCNLVKPGGILLLGAPNMKGINRVLYTLLDRKFLKAHVLEAMDLNCWEKLVTGRGFKVLHKCYYHTFKFYGYGSGFLSRRICKFARSFSLHINERIHLPNRFTSPNLVLVARKNDE